VGWPLSLRRRVRASLLVAAGATCLVAAVLLSTGVFPVDRPLPPYPRFTSTLLDLPLGRDHWLVVQANERETCAYLWPPWSQAGRPTFSFAVAMVCNAR
jgi:hypothetical protein